MRHWLSEVHLNLTDRFIIWLFWRSTKLRPANDIMAFAHWMATIGQPVSVYNQKTGQYSKLHEVLQSRED